MNKKFCTNCGHGNPIMAGGSLVNFCSSCGSSMNPRPNSRVGASVNTPLREEDSSEDRPKDIKEIVSGLKVRIDGGQSGTTKLSDIASQEKTNFSRGTGRGWGGDAIEAWTRESSAHRGDPEEV